MTGKTTLRHRVANLFSAGRAALAAMLAAAPLVLGSAPAGATPTLSDTDMSAPPGILVSLYAMVHFDNAGTNPRFTAATFSTREYYSETDIDDGRVFIMAKTAAQLNALPSPPSNPFTVTVTVTMTNDEGETATGDIYVKTSYARTAGPVPAPAPTGGPTPSDNQDLSARPGVLVSIFPEGYFDNAGTNPRIIAATFSTMEYYDASVTGAINDGRVWIRTKSNDELNALPTPPSSPFTVEVTVTMTNDEGQTATSTVNVISWYAKVERPGVPEPTLSGCQNINARINRVTRADAGDCFDNAGTNPRFTQARFSPMEYLSHSRLTSDGAVTMRITHLADLRALPTPPPSPFTVTAEVTMTNDEGQTATGTITFQTTYSVEPLSTEPVARENVTIKALPGIARGVYAYDVFTNLEHSWDPRISTARYSTTKYFDTYQLQSNIRPRMTFTPKSNQQLSDMSPPPPNPITLTATVMMRDLTDMTAYNTFTITIPWTRLAPTRYPSPTAKTVTINQPVGINGIGRYTARDLFDNPGPDAGLTSVRFSTMAYYDSFTWLDPNSNRGTLVIMTKSAAQLNAMRPPPSSPFTVTITLTMTNGRGQTATGSFPFQTTYNRIEPPPPPPPPPPPTAKTGTITVPGSAAGGIALSASDLFDNAGTNAILVTEGLSFSTRDYYQFPDSGVGSDGRLRLLPKSDLQLNSLSSRPPSPFTVTVTVKMTNDEGQTATGKFSMQTTYERIAYWWLAS